MVRSTADRREYAPQKGAQIDYNPQVHTISDYDPTVDVYWKDIENERAIFRTLFEIQRPLVLKGPTGSGKTTFVRRMHLDIGNELKDKRHVPAYVLDESTGIYVKNTDTTERAPTFPLYIIDGTEDTEIIHILGGFSHTGRFIGGPMYHWAHTGGILLVNEIAELRGDVQTIFHSPLDKERTVWIPDLERIVKLPDHAMLVAAYNPGYQSKRHPLKISTKQRLPAMEFRYPPAEVEAEIVYNASRVRDQQVDMQTAKKLADLAAKIRSRDKEESALANREGVSTRLLVMAAEMIASGLSTTDACRTAIVHPLASTEKKAEALEAIVHMCGL